MAANKLTAMEFKNLKANEKEQLVTDGDNLFVTNRQIYRQYLRDMHSIHCE